jgi:Glycosyl hydrolase catalytic core.
MIVPRPLRFAVLVVIVLMAVPAAAVKAMPRMPVGFFDDPSFRWSTVAPTNLRAASAAHASIVHALADWSQIAPEKPANPLNGDDPAYNLSDLDTLVSTAPKYGLQVLITITGTPKWANGGKTTNHPPTHLADLTNFAHMLAARYNGRRPGFGAVTRWSVWNEPNLQLFLTPQFNASGKIVSPQEYVKLWMAAYTGIKAGNSLAQVAAGETSNRGHNRPTAGNGINGTSDSVAPATFANLVAKAAPHLPFVAWAEHPYPSIPHPSATQKATYPEVRLTNIDKFGASLQQWFHRRVPIWVTEWAEQTAPEYSQGGGISHAQQAKDVKTAIQLAQASPYVEMFVWFIFRDSTSQTWFSGIENKTGARKPAYSAWVTAAKATDGQSIVVAPNRVFTAKIAVPLFSYYDTPGTPIGVTYLVFQGKAVAAEGQPRVTLAADQTVSFTVKFKPAKGVTYTMTVNANDKHGWKVKRTVTLLPSS